MSPDHGQERLGGEDDGRALAVVEKRVNTPTTEQARGVDAANSRTSRPGIPDRPKDVEGRERWQAPGDQPQVLDKVLNEKPVVRNVEFPVPIPSPVKYGGNRLGEDDRVLEQLVVDVPLDLALRVRVPEPRDVHHGVVVRRELGKQGIVDPATHRKAQQGIVVREGLRMFVPELMKDGRGNCDPEPGRRRGTRHLGKMVAEPQLFEGREDPNRKSTARPGGSNRKRSSFST